MALLQATESKWLPSDHYGIMPHSNILLAMGTATLLKNAARICASLCSSCMASCSCWVGGFFVSFACHNCSQEDVWYFWTTLLATKSMIGYCCAPVTLTQNSTSTTPNR